MRKIILAFAIGILFMGCEKSEKKSDGYVVKGTAKGVYNGIRAYLNVKDERGGQRALDTAIVMNEAFEFTGKVNYPQMLFFSVSNVPGIVPLMVENETIEIEFDKTNIENSKVSGTKSNEALAEYTEGFKKLTEKRMELNKEYTTAMNSTDSTLKARITEDFRKVNEDMQNFPYKFLETSNDNYFSLSLIENILKTNPTDLTEIEKRFANLDDDIKNSEYGGMVKSQIDQLKVRNERFAMLEVGKIAPNFSAPDTTGNQLSLNDAKGKVTIIDFWASWCGPCRRENPNVVRTYEKYHSKGLEIIGVSLDRQGQKDKWLKAIEDDKLTWKHVSNLAYFNDPVAQMYNIQSIPATFILDADGKIVAKNLRGQQLEDKIAELLN